MQTVVISKSSKPGKKLIAKLITKQGAKTTHFGQAGASDYRQHRDDERKARHLARHRANEDWTKQGAMTAGFLSRHLLWSEPTLEQSVGKLNPKYRDLQFRLA